jgi:ABC-type antimicrobial peptide transport system permease subunit
VHAAAPGLPVLALRTLARQVNERVASERLLAGMSGVLGALALLLAAIGIYGIVAYTVVRRTTELGIRAALGATPADLLWRVTSATVAVVAVGIGLGVAIAAGASGLVTSMLYGVEPGDPRVYGTAAVALLLTAMAAALPPVMRALRFDPVAALRSE